MKRMIVTVSLIMVMACSGTKIKPVYEAVKIMQIKQHKEAALQMALRYFVTGELSKEKIKERCVSCHPELDEPKEEAELII
jgi:hypothetical protein